MSNSCMSETRAKDLARLKMVIPGKEDDGYHMRISHKKQWKQLDRLMNNRCVEFEWVKAHEIHRENNLCDHLTKQAARNSRKNNYPLTKYIHKTKSAIRGIFLTINQRSSINTTGANARKR
ncbi:MAG: hypothetical protein KGY60_06510 [Bacteroidales bacterium]|nr:hypothetical protein [Bacteroidales bacterium]